MQKQMLGGKIHRAAVTVACIDYPGSITIDKKLMDAADILPHEKVLIANLNNGSRIESYAIPGPAGSGMICLNGGAAKHGKVGDIVIILTFVVLTVPEAKRHKPKVVFVDSRNHIVKNKK
jgi:aspartate 1-decarboxylase